ncbi:hypothetical protein [Alkalihalobacillus sp. 1P02AB]|uniref:hypothetical protein n=1 Tax=Alkalihalobacillus sp. 1P02AB TaxID=3132260 RepID=UPI0039A5ACD1
MKRDEMVILTKEQLDDIIYYTTRRAVKEQLDNLYKGLSQRYFEQYETDLRLLNEKLDHVLVHVKYKSETNEEKESTSLKDQVINKSELASLLDKAKEKGIELPEFNQRVPMNHNLPKIKLSGVRYE